MAPRIDPAERLLDLLIALTHAQGRLTKSQVRASVHGYQHAASDAAFERMFERDKDLLRDLGVPVVTESDVLSETDVGYRIDSDEYELPPIEVTAAEIGVLSLAADVWHGAWLHGPARRALTKLRAVAPQGQLPVPESTLVHLHGPESAFEPLVDSIAHRRHVSFQYRGAASGEITRRRVQPWRVVSRDRGWYLVGYDVNREAPRAFRLNRILGRVRVEGEAGSYEVPPHDAAAMIDGRGTTEVTARIAVRPGSAARLRAESIDTGEQLEVAGEARDIYEFTTRDMHTFAEELRAYGEAIIVLAPAELRASVVGAHRSLIAALEVGRDG